MRRDHGLESTVGLAVCALLATACANVHGPDDSPTRPAGTTVSPKPDADGERTTVSPKPDADGERTNAPTPAAGSSAAASSTPADRSTPADDPPLFLIKNDAETELAVMRNGKRIAELPAFASWPGYDRPGVTTVVSSAEFAVVRHMATRDDAERGIAANADPGVQPLTSTVQRVMLVRRSDWQVLWQRTSAWLSGAAEPKLAADGRIVLVETPFESYGTNAVVVGLNGEEEPVEYSTPLSAPNADGWMAASTPGYGRTIYGFSHAREQIGVRPLSERLQGDGANEQHYSFHPHLRADGSFEYISEDAQSGELALVHEGPSSLLRIPLGRSPDGHASFVRGEHGRLVLSVVASTGRARPWLRVDRDGAVHPVDTELLQDKDFPSCCAVASDWIGFHDGDNPYAVAGWLNADTGAVKLAPPPPAGMQPFAIDNCMPSPMLREDGRVWMALRDDVIGGVFFEDDDGGFMRVGLPIRDALSVDITRVAETLKLDVIDSLYRYCQAPSWTSPEPAEPFLRGGQTELLRAGRSLVIDHRSGYGVELDPSGRHAAVHGETGTVLHDLELGTEHALPEGTHIVGWLGGDRGPGAD